MYKQHLFPNWWFKSNWFDFMFQINHSDWINSVIWIKLMTQIAFGVICIYLLYLHVVVTQVLTAISTGISKSRGQIQPSDWNPPPKPFFFLCASTFHIYTKLWSLDSMVLTAFLTFSSLPVDIPGFRFLMYELLRVECVVIKILHWRNPYVCFHCLYLKISIVEITCSMAEIGEKTYYFT